MVERRILAGQNAARDYDRSRAKSFQSTQSRRREGEIERILIGDTTPEAQANACRALAAHCDKTAAIDCISDAMRVSVVAKQHVFEYIFKILSV